MTQTQRMPRRVDDQGVGSAPVIGLSLIDAATLVTLLGLGLGCIACVLAIRGHLNGALLCLVGAGLCDTFDGPIARRFVSATEQRTFGAAIDLLADMAGFGIVPAVIVLTTHDGWLPTLAVVMYTISAAIRLAYFEVTNTEAAWQGFWGVPVTYVALVLPLTYLVTGPRSDGVAVPLSLLALATLFLVRVRIPKPTAGWYSVIGLVAIGMIWLLLRRMML